MARKRCVRISIEGINGAGKTEHTQMLVSSLRERSLVVESMHFPDYSTEIGMLIRKTLAGGPYDPGELMKLFAQNRVEALPKIQTFSAVADVIIFDRYSESELAYGQYHALLKEWLLEQESQMPVADLVILLDIDPAIAYVRVARRPTDRFEVPALLAAVRENYLALAVSPPFSGQRWRMVNTSPDIRTVHEEMYMIASQFLDEFPYEL